MIDCLVLIKEDYQKVHKKYVSITGSEATAKSDSEIICDDIRFENRNGWCMLTLLFSDSFAEEILLELSDGKKLLYFYSDDSQMDCEFLVVNEGKIIRKKYIYFDTPELNEDEGFLKCESERKFAYWNDIDYFQELARTTPDSLFEV